MTALRQLVHTLIAATGYRLVRSGAPIRTYAECFANLRRLGLRPGTVFDIGVAEGTPALYASFPDAKHVLIEPLAEYRSHLERIGRRVSAHCIVAAAGDAPGTTIIRVGRDKRKSSVARGILKGDVTEHRTVPVVTLDEVCREQGFPAPYVIKADVEGAELRVMEGARRILPTTEAVVLEVTVWDPANHLPEMAEVVGRMHEAGFVPYDIIGAASHPANAGLAHVDLVFVQRDGRFRPTSRPF